MKKLLHFLILTLITLCFNGCFWGRGWLMPYSFQPSYHKFKKMCKLNELPNDEYKYNKILAYFDTSLDTIDWEELNKKTFRLTKGINSDYVEGKLEYRVKIATIRKKRYNISVDLYANNKGFSKENITYIETYGTWYTKRYYLSGNEGTGIYWSEIDLSCTNVVPLKYDYAERIK